LRKLATLNPQNVEKSQDFLELKKMNFLQGLKSQEKSLICQVKSMQKKEVKKGGEIRTKGKLYHLV